MASPRLYLFQIAVFYRFLSLLLGFLLACVRALRARLGVAYKRQ